MLLGTEFNNETTTSFGNFHLLETFKQSIDVKGIISQTLTLRKDVNSVYSAEDTLDFLIDSCSLLWVISASSTLRLCGLTRDILKSARKTAHPKPSLSEINLWLKSFLEKCEKLLPPNYVLKGTRVDKGFFSEPNIEYVESRSLAYVAKVPLYPNVRYYLETLPQEDWVEVNEFTSVTRKKLLLNTWKHDRYIDVRRLKIEKQTGQMMLPEAHYYRYDAVLSSELEQSPEENLS